MSTRKKVDKLDVPMSAMIDIVFLLLIFFIATFKENKVEAHLAINMPSPSSQPTETKPKLLEVYIYPDTMAPPDGYMWMGIKMVKLERIQELLISAASFDTEMTVLIKVHPDATEKQLVDILDRCANAGLTKLNVLRLKT